MTPLDKALQAAMKDGVKAGQFYGLFLQTDIFIPTHEVPEVEGERHVDDDEVINPIILENEGDKILLLFDQLERLQNFAHRELGYVVLPGHVILDSMPEGLRWVLNHGTDHAKEFVPEEIEYLKREFQQPRSEQAEVPEDTKIMIGAPAKVPEGLMAALKEACQRNGDIVAAHLGQIFIGTEGEVPHLALVVSTNGANNVVKTAIMAELTTAARTALGKDEQIELLIDQQSEISQVITREVAAFYQTPSPAAD